MKKEYANIVNSAVWCNPKYLCYFEMYLHVLHGHFWPLHWLIRHLNWSRSVFYLNLDNYSFTRKFDMALILYHVMIYYADKKCQLY